MKEKKGVMMVISIPYLSYCLHGVAHLGVHDLMSRRREGYLIYQKDSTGWEYLTVP